MTPDAFAELFRQCAFISALVGGFSFAFLGLLLAAPGTNRAAGWTAAFAALATTGLVICALGWTFSVAKVIALPATTPFTLPEDLREIHRALSKVFLLCFLLFLAGLGVSGWIRSRALGIVTSVTAAAGLLFTLWLLPHFIS